MIAENRFNISLLIIRIFLGIVVLAHGFQKLFGWFEGFGFDGTMEFFTATIGLPNIFGFLIIFAETFGMVALMLGLFGRIVSGGLVVIMLGAIFSVHASNGFFMNWGGAVRGEGYEYHLLIITLALVVTISGSGAYSLDQIVIRKKRQTANNQS